MFIVLNSVLYLFQFNKSNSTERFIDVPFNIWKKNARSETFIEQGTDGWHLHLDFGEVESWNWCMNQENIERNLLICMQWWISSWNCIECLFILRVRYCSHLKVILWIPLKVQIDWICSLLGWCSYIIWGQTEWIDTFIVLSRQLVVFYEDKTLW